MRMIDTALPPLPVSVLAIQKAYAKMLSEIHSACWNLDIAPSMGMVVACLGDDTLTPAEIQRRGYFIGTNLTATLDKLEREYLIERVKKERDRRLNMVRLTLRGRTVAITIRLRMSNRIKEVTL